jgi:hypothetical protein
LNDAAAIVVLAHITLSQHSFGAFGFHKASGFSRFRFASSVVQDDGLGALFRHGYRNRATEAGGSAGYRNNEIRKVGVRHWLRLPRRATSHHLLRDEERLTRVAAGALFAA